MSGSDAILLAVDAGGSHTRAVVVDSDGACLGYGVSTSGNATAVGVEEALVAIRTAARRALTQAARDARAVGRVVLAAAGEQGRLNDAVVRAALGLRDAQIDRVVDILAMYHSAAVEPDGIALVAGTGAVAARFSSLSPVRVVDGTGWLLGDHGSGFWIGRKVARAVAAHLDGSGPATSLTDLVVAKLGLPREGTSVTGLRPVTLDALLREVYDDRPVRLARLAPLAFEAAADDPTAREIVEGAEAALAHNLHVVRDGFEDLPVVVGGSVIVEGILREGTPNGPLAEELAGADVRRIHDGAAGAGVVGLMLQGVTVTPDMLGRLLADIAARRRSAVPA